MDFYANEFREKIVVDLSFVNLDCVQCEHKEELCAKRQLFRHNKTLSIVNLTDTVYKKYFNFMYYYNAKYYFLAEF